MMNLHVMLRALRVTSIVQREEASVSADSLSIIIWETVHYKSA